VVAAVHEFRLEVTGMKGFISLVLALALRTVASLAADKAVDSAPPPDNRYLVKVDAAISTPEVRAAIRRVQPACLRLGSASGVNLTRSGLVLTNAHVAGRTGKILIAQFPDGGKFRATCVALDRPLDLALCRLNATGTLPFANVAETPPPVGARVVCIGQPGASTPKGDKTGYQPFHVSVGSIRGYHDDPLGNQEILGRAMHDAWTYWGHSGSPLFDDKGRIVAIHNSWNPDNGMRHAVPLQAIRRFLNQQQAGVEAARLQPRNSTRVSRRSFAFTF
jgi:S1-C subfamily serine protease